jgi:hypothetical protein
MARLAECRNSLCPKYRKEINIANTGQWACRECGRGLSEVIRTTSGRKGWPTTARGARRHLAAMDVKHVARMLRDLGITENSGACARELVRKEMNEKDVLKAAQKGEFFFRRFIQMHCSRGRASAKVGRDMSSELRGYSLQALGRMLRKALNQGDEHKARLIEQEIDRRTRRR